MPAEILLGPAINVIAEQQATNILAVISDLVSEMFEKYQTFTDEDSLTPESFINDLLEIENSLLLLTSYNRVRTPRVIEIYKTFYNANVDLIAVCRMVSRQYPEMLLILNSIQTYLRALLTYQVSYLEGLN